MWRRYEISITMLNADLRFRAADYQSFPANH